MMKWETFLFLVLVCAGSTEGYAQRINRPRPQPRIVQPNPQQQPAVNRSNRIQRKERTIRRQLQTTQRIQLRRNRTLLKRNRFIQS